MIENVVILNYKSAREVQLSCRRLNILIGEPNTGKSNILEALGLFTLFNTECKIQDLARFQTMHNLFYDNAIDSPIHIRTNKHRIKIQFKENFEVYVEVHTSSAVKSYDLYYDASGKLLNSHPHYSSPVNLYKFKPEHIFSNKSIGHLRPPFGDNLVLMLMKNRDLRKQAADIFTEFGYRLAINPLDSTINIQKEQDGVIISHPFTMASPILQRFVFHLTAIETNENAVIIFEEPESYASTEYTREIASRIASDKTNQFFISTHNPNFLVRVLKEIPHEDVKIYYTFYRDYQTVAEALIEEDYDDILKGDIDILAKLKTKLEQRL
jgi:AAA15 family ATPase/GTPase